MEKNYYKAYYRLERSHWWFVARGEMLMAHLGQIFEGRKSLKILNIGTATGRTSELLAQFGEVTSLEYDEDCCQFVRQEVGIAVEQGSILDLRFADETFDLVCAFDVIEHVDDDNKAVAEMHRVAKRGGVISVSVPAFMFLWSQHDVVNHHFRRYRSAELSKLFEQLRQSNKLFHSYFNFWLFFPIAVFRLIAKLLPERKIQHTNEMASDFEVLRGGAINKILYTIFKSENFFLQKKWRLPVGVSLLSSWKKHE